MRIRFTWNETEWREALRLANWPREGQPPPVLLYSILLIMAAGAGPDVLAAMHSGHVFGIRNSTMPVVVVAGALTCSFCLLVRHVRLRRNANRMPEVPSAVQELTLLEEGWRLGRTDGECLDLTPTRTGVAASPLMRSAERWKTERTADVPISAEHSPRVLRSWKEFHALRQGRHVYVLLAAEGFAGLPLRALSAEQGSYLLRMLKRKIPRDG